MPRRLAPLLIVAVLVVVIAGLPGTMAATSTRIGESHDYVDQVSNLHAPTDIGTHSSFAEEQDFDLVYDTLTEADTDTGTGTFGKTSGSGTSYRTTVANEVRMGVFSAATTGELALEER